MKAVRYYGKEDIRVETVPDPVLLNPWDAIVKVTTTAICGSDRASTAASSRRWSRGTSSSSSWGRWSRSAARTRGSPWATASWSRSPSPAAAATSARRTSGRSATTPTRTRGWSRRSAATRARAVRLFHMYARSRAGRRSSARAVRRRRTDQGARHALGRAGAVPVRHLPTGYMAAENCSIGRTTPLPSGAAARSASSRSRARICSAPRG